MKKSLLLVFAFLCILSLTSCSKRSSAIRTWAQHLEQEDILSAKPWNCIDELKDLAPLNDADIHKLVGLLNSLPKDRYTENKHLAGITPTFGLQITTTSGICHINEANAPDGALEIIYDGTQWWIDSPELTTFVQTVTDSLLSA